MTEYYFDIKTANKDPNDTKELASMNPITGKIITIQYQQIESQTGLPIGPLTILKEWEDGSSERNILQQFKPLITGYCWDFIPLGTHLYFEFIFLKHKFKEYFNYDFSADDFFSRPMHDLKIIGVILNNGAFKGSSLDRFLNKESGYNIPVWYRNKQYDKIIDYIKTETEAYLKFWQKLKKELPRIFSDAP